MSTTLTLTIAFISAMNLGIGRQDTPGCMPDDRTMEGLVIRVRAGIGGSKNGEWHGLPMERSDTVVVLPVRNDSLCRMAVETLNNYLLTPLPKNGRIRLLYMKSSFFAEFAPGEPQVGEFVPQYIFDSTLKKVLFPCRSGLAKC